jgi:hypothetical protein
MMDHLDQALYSPCAWQARLAIQKECQVLISLNALIKRLIFMALHLICESRWIEIAFV